jgi:hypothetical protein
MKGPQLHVFQPLRDFMLCYVTVLQMKGEDLVKVKDVTWSGGTQPVNDGKESELLMMLPNVIFNRSEFFSAVQSMMTK